MMASNLNIGAANGSLVQQLGRMSNRHGLVAGATGTGKTVTLQVLAEGFSRMGVPVFAVDVKGDLSGIAAAGNPHPKIDERLAQIPLPDYRQQPCPTVLWDMDGQHGHPVRTTITEMGPLLLSNLLALNDTQTSVLYAGFDLADDQGLMLLAELFEQLPECGDPPAPKMVLFFDEAHMLFDGALKPLLDKIEQVVRLIRSKGVGIYFITRNPLDIPEDVLGQLGMKVQHALRAFTPKDQKTIKAVAASFVANPAFKTVDAVTSLGIGEALVSVLTEDGRPLPVEKTLIAPPESRIGLLSDAERGAVIQRSPLKGRYDEPLDRPSAYEMLKARAEAAQVQEAQAQAELAAAGGRQQEERARRGSAKGGRRRQSAGEAMMKSAARAMGSQIGRQIIRGLLGSIFGRR